MAAGGDRYVIVAPDYYNGRDNFFYGIAGKYYWVPIVGSSSDGQKFSLTFWDPRVVNGVNSQFLSKDGVHKIRCADRVTTLKQLSAEDSRKIMAKGQFFERLWKRRSFLLARDERGKYYFVDHGRKKNSRDFRVYVGPRGKMKRMRMKNIVYDSEGA
ncbi:MAG TPA: hypothetical protein EYN66_14600, partial [Myxococcales bacterium]|nr:hypothetical protein [Myxococcales bacterium]